METNMHKWIKVSIALLAFLITVPSLCLYFFIQGQLDKFVTEPAPEGMGRVMFSKFNSVGISAKDIIIHEDSDNFENYSGHKVYNHFTYNADTNTLKPQGYFVNWAAHIHDLDKINAAKKTGSLTLDTVTHIADNMRQYKVDRITIDGRALNDEILSSKTHCTLSTCRASFYLDFPEDKNEVEATIDIKGFESYTLKIQKVSSPNISDVHRIAINELGYKLSDYDKDIDERTNAEIGYNFEVKTPQQATKTFSINSNSKSITIFNDHLNPAKYENNHVWNTFYLLPETNTSIFYEIQNESLTKK